MRYAQLRGHRIITRLLITYLIMLVVPVLGGVFAYLRTITILERDLSTTSRTLLENYEQMVNRELESVDRLVTQLSQSPQINSYLSLTPLTRGSPTIARYIEAIDALSLLTRDADMVREVMLYSRRSRTVITPSRLYTDIEREYQAFFAFHDLSFTGWREIFLSTYHDKRLFPAIEVAFQPQPRHVIPYVQSIPPFSASHFRGVVLAFLDTKRLDQLADQITKDAVGTIYLFDSFDTLVHQAGECTFDTRTTAAIVRETSFPTLFPAIARENVITRYHAPTRGLTLVAVQPRAVVTAKLAPFRFAFLAFLLFLIVAGTIIATVLTVYNGRPIVEVVRTAQSYTNELSFDGYDLKYLRKSISTLVENNRELSVQKQAQLPLLRRTVLMRVLLGQITSQRELHHLLEYAEIILSGTHFNVTIFLPSGYGTVETGELMIEKDVIRLLLERELWDSSPENGYLVPVSRGRLAWIHTEGDETALYGTINRVVATMEERHGHQLYVARGYPSSDLLSVSNSYRTALQGVEYLLSFANGKRICHIPLLQEGTSHASYPVETEMKLITAVRTGDGTHVERLLDEVYQENFERHPIAPREVENLLRALSNTARRVAISFASTGTPEDRTEYLPRTEPTTFLAVRTWFHELANGVEALKERKMRELRRAVLVYIREHHHDPNLTIDTVATYFGYKSSYFYHYFTTTVGVSFASYLERVRITTAQRLLRTREEAIDEVAKKVGYNSSHTFRRAFRRRTGVTPSQFQRSMEGKTQKTS